MFKVTYLPDRSVQFYGNGQEEVCVEFVIRANKSLGDYGTAEENAEIENPENYMVEELYSRDLLREIEALVNDKNHTAHFDGAILTITDY